MAKPDLINALVKPSGDVVGDGGSLGSLVSQGSHQNITTQLTPAVSGTVVAISSDTEVLILTPNTGIMLVLLQLPTVAGSAVGSQLTIKNQQETNQDGPAFQVSPATGDRIEATDLNKTVDFGEGAVSVTFINTGSSWDILHYNATSIDFAISI